jgi:enterochelin esterase family protein
MKLHTALGILLFCVLCANYSFAPTFAQDAPLAPKKVYELLQGKLSDADAEKLAGRLRTWFGNNNQGRDNFAEGRGARSDDLYVVWAVESTTAPRIKSNDGTFTLPMKKLGATNVYAAAAYLPSGTAIPWQFEADGKRWGGGQVEVWATHRDAIEQPGVPKGKVTPMPKWASKIFEGTTRDWWVYVPAQYTSDKPACVMIFQDGQNPKNYMPVIFDNLIHKGDIPVMVGVFISPGVRADGRPNRAFEYDTLSDQYARFLLEEILPEVEKTVKLKHDAESRAIAGISSGGIAAFTAAWQRPNEFHKVLSWVGSFVNIAHGTTFREGGHNYPALIRKTPKRNIRVFLQDGENDLDNANGNWPLANKTMAKALEFAGYDYQFVMGNGFHNDKHGRAILPDSLRWLWRDYGK